MVVKIRLVFDGLQRCVGVSCRLPAKMSADLFNIFYSCVYLRAGTMPRVSSRLPVSPR